MKKILSLFLAVLMLFGALSISSSAATTITPPDLAEAIAKVKATYGENSMYSASDAQYKGYVVVCYNIGVGSYMYEVPALDTATGSIILTKTPGDPYFDIPEHIDENYIGYSNYTLPIAKGTEEKQFNGWYCPANGETYTAGETIQLTSDMIRADSDCIYFNAQYLDVVAESDVLETIINVLIKVFGSIIGFVFFGGDPAQGEKFLSDMIGGILEGA